MGWSSRTNVDSYQSITKRKFWSGVILNDNTYLKDNPDKIKSFRNISNRIQKRKLLIQIISEYLQNYIKSEEFSLSQLGSYKKVLWKCKTNDNDVILFNIV